MKQNDVINELLNTSIKVVSFDIFDTLLKRPVLFPADIFFLIEEKAKLVFSEPLFKFVEIRKEAETLARGTAGGEDITLHEIYTQFSAQFGFSEADARTLEHLEIEVEKSMLRARVSVQALYNQLLKAGKEIIFISDMYLEKSTIEELLRENGYTGWEKLYVSSEYKLLKQTGNLYKRVIKEYKKKGIAPHEICHIGDNPEADVSIARQHGMQSIYVPKAVDMAKENKGIMQVWGDFFRESDRRHFGIRFILGMIFNTLYDSPWEDHCDDSYFEGSPYIFGYYIMAIPLFFWVKSIIEQAIHGRYEELYFLSRDSYIPLQLYNRLAEIYPSAPVAHYLLNSRLSLSPMVIKQKRDIINHIKINPVSPEMPLSFFLERRLYLPVTRSVELFYASHGFKEMNKPINNVKKIVELSMQFHKEIIENCKRKTEIIKEYYKDTIGNNKKKAIVDIGYRGTVQAQFGSLLNTPVDAFYFYIFNEAWQLKSFNYGVFPFLQGKNTGDTMWYHIAQFSEFAYSEKSPQLIDFVKRNDNHIEPVFDDYILPEQSKSLSHTIQQGLSDFITDVMEWFGPYAIHLQVESGCSIKPLEKIISYPQKRDAMPFIDLVFEDKMLRGNNKQIHMVTLDKEKHNSLWAAGNAAIKREVQQVACHSSYISLRRTDSNPLISVIIPVYESEQFLPSCFNYLLAQKYRYLEIIVVNDASPGNCRELVAHYQKRDKRINYIELDNNMGLFLARLKGLQQARGEYIAHLDPDDRILPEMYETLINKALDTNADIVHCDVLQVDMKGNEWIEDYNKINYSFLEGQSIFNVFTANSLGKGVLQWFWHVVWNKIYRKDLLLSIPELWSITDHIIMHEDILSSTMVLFNAKKMAAVQTPLFYYYRHHNGATKKCSVKAVMKRIHDDGIVIRELKKFLENRTILEEYEPFYKQWLEYFAKGDRRIIKKILCDKKDKIRLKDQYNYFFRPFGYRY